MTDESLPNKPEVTFEFNLPHGIDPSQKINDALEHRAHASEHTDSTEANPGLDSQQEVDYRAFSPGFSDDEGSSEAFERSWPGHQAKKQAAKAAKGKKSPRRSDDESEDSASNTRAKKPRQFLFGGADAEMEMDKQADNLLAPATPGLGLGSRMSSLTLDQQDDRDKMEQPTNNGFGLACSDIGSVRESPPPSDDEFVIPPDTVVSSFDRSSS